MDTIKVPPTIPQQALSPSNTPNSVLSTTDQLGSAYNNFMTQLSDLTKQYSTAMTPTSQEQDLIGQLNALNQGERQGLLNVENKVIPMEFITGQQASIQKQAAINRQALAENLSALQGNRQAQLDSLSKQIELANLGYSTTADFEKLQREANKLDTNIVTLDNGRTLLVDTQTGNIIKDYGGIKPETGTASDSSTYRDQTASNILSFIDTAISQVGPLSAGFGSEFISDRFRGSKARDLRNTLETIKANIGFESLQAMREASKTGGALGQVAVQELTALQAILGSLDPSQNCPD